MKKFIITTDGNSDLTEDYAREHDIRLIPLYYNLDGKLYGGDDVLSPEAFYAKMREGKMPTTMAVNPQVVEKTFRSVIEDGYDILHIAFSSALSGSYNVTAMVGQQLCEELPDTKIIVIDSLSASLGQGLLIHKANQLRDQGATLEETAQWVEDHKLHMCHQFTVDNLFHLFRGGRVSRTTAVLGTLAQIKPVLHVDDEGRLVAVGKVRGRKKSLNALVDKMEETIGSYRDKNDIIFISHGDCIDDARYVADRVKERFGIDQFYIDMVNPTIGAHSGPGTVALFYLGDRR
ncbi:MAG TPA: DegV family protein [Candidatus Scybalocola faecavium]|nr:DegV family protein [Candidatus Scybalocola faecavium]